MSNSDLADFDNQSLEKRLEYLATIKAMDPDGNISQTLKEFGARFQQYAVDDKLIAMVVVAENGNTYLIHLNPNDEDWQQLPIKPFDEIRSVGEIDGDQAFVVKRGEDSYETLAYVLRSNGRFLCMGIGDLVEDDYDQENSAGKWPQHWKRPEQ